MKTFKQFITEMPSITTGYAKDKNQLKDHETIPYQNSKPVSTTETGHVVQHRNTPGTTTHHLDAYDPKSDTVHVRVLGQRIGNAIQVLSLKGSPSSTLRAPAFYHHIVHHTLDKIGVDELHSSELQSQGGAKTWKKLSQMPDITVERRTASKRAFGKDKKVKLHTGDNWHKNYADDQSYFVARKK